MPSNAPTDEEKLAANAHVAALKSIFRPSAPTEDRALFKGRDVELQQTLSAIQSPGQHVVIYGERGVGKTSLAKVAREVFLSSVGRENGLAVRIQCGSDDDFISTWKKLSPRLEEELSTWSDDDSRIALNKEVAKVNNLVSLNRATPDSASRALSLLGNRIPIIVVLDEFDRIVDRDARRLFADMIKTASDDQIKCTILIVGIADDVEDLVLGHRSIERAIREIRVPRMQATDLSQLITDGFRLLAERTGRNIALDPSVVSTIVKLSEGFPYYTHLLAESVGEVTIRQGLDKVEMSALGAALGQALENATQTIRASYTEAVEAARVDATYTDTLLACALTKVDELGYFSAPGVKTPLARISKRDRPTSSFQQHLKKFAQEPSPILETKERRGRRHDRGARYRFQNPLMKSFVIIKAFKEERIKVSAGGQWEPS
jgi:energy-coupling factor transporter ATP-binding protein EcfA2